MDVGKGRKLAVPVRAAMSLDVHVSFLSRLSGISGLTIDHDAVPKTVRNWRDRRSGPISIFLLAGVFPVDSNLCVLLKAIVTLM
jgi:hypothetical protein